MSRARVRAYRRGLFAETVAALLFRLKGYRVVARRYKTPVGEIDLVALKGRRLAFIEVKARQSRERCGMDIADPAAAAHRARRAILALKPPRLRRIRHGLRRGARRTLAPATPYRECISRLTEAAFGCELSTTIHEE